MAKVLVIFDGEKTMPNGQTFRGIYGEFVHQIGSNTFTIGTEVKYTDELYGCSYVEGLEGTWLEPRLENWPESGIVVV